MAAVFALARTGMVGVTVATDRRRSLYAESLLERTAACAVVDDGAGRHWGPLTCVRLDPASAPDLHGEPDDSLRVDRPGALLMYSNSSGTTGVPKVFGVTHESCRRIAAGGDREHRLSHRRAIPHGSLAELRRPRGGVTCAAWLRAARRSCRPRRRPGCPGRDHRSSRRPALLVRASQAYEMARAVPAGTGPRFPRMRCLRLSAGPSEASLHRFVREQTDAERARQLRLQRTGSPHRGTARPAGAAPGVGRSPDAGGGASRWWTRRARDASRQGGADPVARPGMPTAYLNDEQTSAKSFRDGWFYPGDLGRWTEDGLLCHMGRADDMMILNGINIYPAEIEQAMLSHPAVRRGRRVAAEAPGRQRRAGVCGGVKGGERVSEQDLLSYARGRLGSHRPKWVARHGRHPAQRTRQGAAAGAGAGGRRQHGRPAARTAAERGAAHRNAEPGVPGQLALFATVSFRRAGRTPISSGSTPG